MLSGIAVIGIMYAIIEYAASVVERRPTIDGPEALATIGFLTLSVGVPSSFVVGLLAAWVTHLRRPWLVSLAGLLNTVGFMFGSELLGKFAGFIPRWALCGSLIILAYIAAAVLVNETGQPEPGINNSSRWFDARCLLPCRIE